MKVYLLFGRISDGPFNIPCTMYGSKDTAVDFAASRQFTDGSPSYIVHELDVDPGFGYQMCEAFELNANGDHVVNADMRLAQQERAAEKLVQGF